MPTLCPLIYKQSINTLKLVPEEGQSSASYFVELAGFEPATLCFIRRVFVGIYLDRGSAGNVDTSTFESDGKFVEA